jgi:hypothetical protein
MRRKPSVLALTGVLRSLAGGMGGGCWAMCDFTMMDAGQYLLLWQELLSRKLLAIPVPAACIVLPGEKI